MKFNLSSLELKLIKEKLTSWGIEYGRVERSGEVFDLNGNRLGYVQKIVWNICKRTGLTLGIDFVHFSIGGDRGDTENAKPVSPVW